MCSNGRASARQHKGKIDLNMVGLSRFDRVAAAFHYGPFSSIQVGNVAFNGERNISSGE